MVLFFETNAVLKRYLLEPGSATIDAILDLPEFMGGRFISTAVLLEVNHVLGLKVRVGNLTEPQHRERVSHLHSDRLTIWTVLPVVNDAVAHASHKAQRDFQRGVDGFDHLHLATALHAAAFVLPDEDWVFVTSDKKLIAYAKQNGMKCFDPENGAPTDLLAHRFA